MLLPVPIFLALQSNSIKTVSSQSTPFPQVAIAGTMVPNVPFYSQFSDISSSKWKGKGCGITSLAMVIGYYKQNDVSVDGLLEEGISDKAYDSSAGWIYNGLIAVAQNHGMTGSAHDLGGTSSTTALAQFKQALKTGPVIASVHYKFDPKSTIPHLVVIDAIKNGVVYYNDPAATSGELQISLSKFMGGWKKRYIIIRPKQTAAVA